MHINSDFLTEVAARNCGFRSIASVGAQIYGFVSNDAHAASGRKQLFAACLRCDRPVGGRNRLVNDGAVFYESAEKTGQSAVYIFLPDNLFLIKNVIAWVIVYKITKVFRQINVILFFPSGRKILKTVDFNTLM